MTRYIQPIDRIFARRPIKITPVDKLVPSDQIPRPDAPKIERRFFEFAIASGGFDDKFVTDGPYLPVANITLLAVQFEQKDDFTANHGLRIYYTPTQPTSVNDLLDRWQVWPQRRTLADALTEEISWGLNALSFIPVSDRKRNFAGWFSIRFRNASGLGGTMTGYIQINQAEED